MVRTMGRTDDLAPGGRPVARGSVLSGACGRDSEMGGNPCETHEKPAQLRRSRPCAEPLPERRLPC